MRIIETDNYEIVAALNEPAHALHARLYPEYFQPFDYDAMKRFFQSAVSRPYYVFLLLEDDGQPLGYAWIEYKTVPENAFKKSCRSLYVHQISIADSEIAVQFYRKHGFIKYREYIYKEV